jgi:sodium/bile acid cotransporter 7
MLATAINYGLLPLFAWGVTLALGRWPGLSEDIVFGILIAAAVPCTLASAAVWTRRAGGNDAAAIIVTIVTNLMCFVVTPAWLYAMIGKMPSFDPLSMVLKLALLVVLPMVLAQLVRPVGSIGAWATGHKTPIGVVTQCGVLSMVFFGAIQTGSRFSGGPQSSIWIDIVLTIAIVMCLHVTMLFVGTGLARLMRLSREDAMAVGFAGSQKSCMIGLEVCAQLGVTVLPMVAYHVCQLLADTAVADRFRRIRGG